MNIDDHLNGVKLIKPKVFEDDRGFFMESYSSKAFAEVGIHNSFVQDNHSYSVHGTIRGIHFQKWPGSQAKLVRCIRGDIFDVVVDLRPGSPTYLQWRGFILTEHNKQMLFIPNGFGHGFQSLSPKGAEVCYKCDSFYDANLESSWHPSSKAFGISWPEEQFILSERDKKSAHYPIK